MNSNHIYEYISNLERVLSFGYKNEYASSYIERAISYSSFFIKLESSDNSSSPIINDKDLIEIVYKTKDPDLNSLPIYNQCLWAAEAYIRIQQISGLTFESIFLYIPLEKMYRYFPLYHEMDFAQIINEFLRLYSLESVLSLLLKKYHYSLRRVSEKTNIPYDTLFSIKQRRRELSKTSFEVLFKLSKIFNVRLETISQIRQ